MIKLYELITNPFHFIKTYTGEHLPKLGLFCLILASLCVASEANGHLTSLISLTLITTILYGLLLFMQSVTIDFFAQWLLKSQAKSLTLFYWLCISLLPISLWIPLDILNASGKAHDLIAIIKFGIFVLVLAEQITILKTQYQLTTKKSILLYFFPLIFTILSFIALVLTIAMLG